MRLALLVALVAAPLVAAAQPTGLYVTGALARSQYRADAITEANESYSTYYTQRLDGPATLLPSQNTGLALGLVGRVNLGRAAFGFGYAISREASESRTTFENQSGDHVETRTQTHAVSWEVTTDALRPVVLGASLGALFRGVRVASATVYPDGSLSYGTEYRLNGVYTGAPTYFEAGLVAGVALGDRLFVPVRLTLPMDLLGNETALLDMDVRQLNNYFPRDFPRFVNDPTGSAEHEAAIQERDFMGPRLQVGVEIRLF